MIRLQVAFIPKNFKIFDIGKKIDFSKNASKWTFFACFDISYWKAPEIMHPGQFWLCKPFFWKEYSKKSFFLKKTKKCSNPELQQNLKKFFSFKNFNLLQKNFLLKKFFWAKKINFLFLMFFINFQTGLREWKWPRILK